MKLVKEITNMTITTHFGCCVDLFYLTVKIDSFNYDMLNFPGGIWKLKPRGTLLTFSNGKAVLVGVRSIIEAKTLFKYVSKFLLKLGYKCNERLVFQLKNVVGLLTSGERLNMSKAYETLRGYNHNVLFEPELHNSIKWKLEHGTALIFISGKIVVTGCKNTADFHRCVSYIRHMLKKVMAHN